MDNFSPISTEQILNGQSVGYDQGRVEFWIPSFQRGYRWEPQQVKDLLDDLYNFVKSEEHVYFLQPLVVRPHVASDGTTKGWDVLDGQQRLTTMFLLLNSSCLQDRLTRNASGWLNSHLYSINYCTPDREIDWENLEGLEKMDYFYLVRAKKAIEEWFGEKDDNDGSTETMCKILCTKDQRHVDFIWYVVNEKESKDLASIEIFNRLNKGQIKLTPSELIKALFIISKSEDHEALSFAADWDVKEKKFQDDSFWYFLNDKKVEVQTRMDLLFDIAFKRFQAEGKTDQTSAYRFVQDEYDKSFVHHTAEKRAFEDLWDAIDGYYNELIHWYEDTTMYNYIGFLVRSGETIASIQRALSEKRVEHEKKGLEWDLDMTYNTLRGLISDIVRDYDLYKIQYDTDPGKVRTALLLFNVLTCNISDQRFPFDKYVNESWDIEHVDSQSGSKSLQATGDKISWLSFVIKGLEVYHTADKGIPALIEKAKGLKKYLEENQKDDDKKFETFYNEIADFQANKQEGGSAEVVDDDKHGLGNLTLLDCKTNRGYKDAPYPYKRYSIISRDKTGGFVPICTKNLFLKYYSDDDRAASQMDIIRWHPEDRENYLDSIYNMLKPFLK